MLKSSITDLSLNINNQILDLCHLVFIHRHYLINLNAARLLPTHWKREKVHPIPFFSRCLGMSFKKSLRWRLILGERLLFTFFKLFKLEKVDFLFLGWLVSFKRSCCEDFEFLCGRFQVLLKIHFIFICLIFLGFVILIILVSTIKKWNYWRISSIIFLNCFWKFNRGCLDSLGELIFTF